MTGELRLVTAKSAAAEKNINPQVKVGRTLSLRMISNFRKIKTDKTIPKIPPAAAPINRAVWLKACPKIDPRIVKRPHITEAPPNNLMFLFMTCVLSAQIIQFTATFSKIPGVFAGGDVTCNIRKLNRPT
jgi:hypothetical protein